MANKTYNCGRVVGWSSYEEFLKENPNVDPNVITEQIFITAVTYGVTRKVELPLTGWTTDDIGLYCIQVPGAVWGAVPIVAPDYDAMNATYPTPQAVEYREEIDSIMARIFAVYTSNSMMVRTANSTSDSGYLTFCARPFPEPTEHFSTIKLIIRGLGIEGLIDGQGYYGPEGMIVGTGSFSESSTWAESLKMSYTPIPVLGGNAYRLNITSQETEDATPITRTFLSLADCETDHVYDLDGQSGVFSPQHVGQRMITWKYLLQLLVDESALDLTIPIQDVVDAMFLAEMKKYMMQALQAGTGISLYQRNLSSKVIISNTMPYNISGEGYLRLHQADFDLGHESEWSYAVTPYNAFQCYVESEGAWLANSAISSSLIADKSVLPLRLRVLPSEDTFIYNDVEYPISISVIIEGVQNYTFSGDSTNYLFCVGKQSAWDDSAGKGFRYQGGNNEPGFTFRHTDAYDSEGYDATLNRWLRGKKSQLFGIEFVGDYSYIHDLLQAGAYQFRSESGGLGIWNILKQASAGAAGSAFGASWEASGQLITGTQAGRVTDKVDIVACVASYADGYNRQLSEWSQNNGDDLLAIHLNMSFSGLFYHPST